MYRFHSKAGPLIKFSNDFRTAERTKAETDFDGGLVFSEMKLQTNTIFQIKFDKKVGIWSGGLEIGVTCIDPNNLLPNTVPRSATEMRNGTWLMSSSTILHDGQPVIENYGFDLEKLEEGDTVGLMRTNQGALVYFIQGVSQGVAVPYIPADIFCLVNLYGKCAVISLVEVNPSEQSTNTLENVVHSDITPKIYSSTENNTDHDKLRFHQKCGPLVKSSNNHRTAERRRPLEEFNNCVLITHRPLLDDELFQIRLDTLIHKWSGSIEFGLIAHDPESFSEMSDFPATLTVVGNGTVVMSGNGVLHDGKATNTSYTNFNLDQLQEGDRIGVMRKSNGDVIYFVNGESQGIATTVTPGGPIWGCCNLYGMAAKVTIVDRNEREEHNLRVTTRNPQDFSSQSSIGVTLFQKDELLFHPNCGFHAAVINNGHTAHRPESTSDFNHGVVLTSRVLHPNEMFEIRLDKIVSKWAGSIEIGVTTHAPTSLDYPCTMTNVRTGTWMMTGNGIMHNGQSMIDEYGQSLDRLKVGDCVGVLRKENGNLHFFVNGIDQGCAVSNVPEGVYGVIDLYGQAAQATIVSHEETNNENNHTSDNVVEIKTSVKQQISGRSTSGESIYSGDLKFHHLHGKNARISSSGITACRPNALGEFNAAIVVSSRALKDNELFEVTIERMVDRWSGNIEAGVTTIKPDNLIFPNTMTDLVDNDTIMLSGSSIMSGGNTITNRYPCNLDCLTVGSKVGMMRKSAGTLHFFINGEDIGAAPIEVSPNIYAVIDLYGQCAQVSITRAGDASMVYSQVMDSLSFPFNDTSHRFAACCGKNIILKNNYLTAQRHRHFTGALAFSSVGIGFDEIFEVRLSEINSKWGGTLSIGVTSLNISDDYSLAHIPTRINSICADTWYIQDSSSYKNNRIIKDNYCVNLNRLIIGDRVGLKICQDRTLRFLINGEEMGIASTNVPKNLHVVIDLFGCCESVLITSTVKTMTASSEGIVNAMTESTMSALSVEDASHVQPGTSSSIHIPIPHVKRSSLPPGFSGKHSRNIELCNGNMTAKRISGYEGYLFSSQILHKGKTFEIRIDKVNPNWTASLMLGVLECNPERIIFPFNAMGFRKSCWLVIGKNVYRNGVRTSEKISADLDDVKMGDILGLMVDSSNNLHLIVEGKDNIIARNVGNRCRALIVLYGEAEQITIMGKDSFSEKEKLWKEEVTEKANKDDDTTEKNVIPGAALSKLKACDYLDACLRFKASLCIPDAFFVQSEPTLCFCENCCKIREECDKICTQGDPPANFCSPTGWVRFPINIVFDNLSTSGGTMTTSTSSLSNVLTTWHVAYHGLKIFDVREVMDCGQLIAADWVPALEEGKDEKSDYAELLFSPSLEYAAIPNFSPTHPFVDSRTRRKLQARVALQILVQPGSYKVGSATHPIPLSVLKSSGMDLENIQWSTKEQGSTQVSNLLVKLDGYFKT